MRSVFILVGILTKYRVLKNGKAILKKSQKFPNDLIELNQ